MAQQNLQQLESHAVVQSSRPNEGTHTENTSGFQSIGNSRGVTQHRVCPFCSGDHFMMNCTGFQQSLQDHSTDFVAQVSARQSASNTFSSRAPEVQIPNAVAFPCLYCHRYGHPMSRCYEFLPFGNSVQTNSGGQGSGYYQNRRQYREPNQTYSRGTHYNLRGGNGRFRPPASSNVYRGSYPLGNNMEHGAGPANYPLNSYRGCLSGGSRSSENLLKSPPVSPFCKISKEYLESPMHMEGGETISVGSFLGQFSRPAPEEVHIFNFFDNALLPLINISFADYLSRMQDPSYRVQVPLDQCIDEDLLLPFVDSPSPHASVNVNTATVEDPVNEISTSTFLTEQSGDTQISEIVNLLRSSSLIGSQKIQDYFIKGNCDFESLVTTFSIEIEYSTNSIESNDNLG
ncbi:hypothetical protein JTE90_023831 [Oedothorax gibbosus]|uniref:Uncharacterized protein n=1 Tax=Oedothorax gibbosus TaxID=931172 RepID=A0AAV6VKT4_9ARAC|nr:hypothetical protein JTE90_023831 [Oedothorax gibbosus]